MSQLPWIYSYEQEQALETEIEDLVRANVAEDAAGRLAVLEPEFSHKCSACDEMLMRPGACSSCTIQADDRRRRHERVEATRLRLPPHYQWATSLSVPHMSARVDPVALAAAKRVRLDQLERITLMGPAASGKTSVACALACEWSAAHGATATVMSAVDLGVARMQAALGSGEAELVDAAITSHLLVVDDLGGEAVTGCSVVEHVIRVRYDNDRPTIVTTGLTMDELLSRHGHGIARRLLEESGGAIAIQFSHGAKRNAR